MDQLGAYLGERESEVLGVDIRRNIDGDAAVDLGGLAVEAGERTALNDIAERLRTRIGSEFYDAAFGADLVGLVGAPADNETEILAAVVELRRAVRADPRVDPETVKVSAKTISRNPPTIQLRADWLWLPTGNPANLAVEITEDSMSVLLDSINLTEAASA